MVLEMWLALGILAFAILFFVTEWLRLDVVAIIVVVALMVSRLLTPAEAVSGFSNTLVLTIAALFVIGGAILQTGLAEMIGNQVLRIAGTNPTRLLIVVMVAVALMSAFMSSTGTVAVLLPAVVSLAASLRISPSKLLIPLAYASLLGGALTLIGTPAQPGRQRRSARQRLSPLPVLRLHHPGRFDPGCGHRLHGDRRQADVA